MWNPCLWCALNSVRAPTCPAFIDHLLDLSESSTRYFVMSTSPTESSVSHTATGRHKTSLVWDYDEQTEKNVCQVLKGGPGSADCDISAICEHKIEKKWPTNLKII